MDELRQGPSREPASPASANIEEELRGVAMGDEAPWSEWESARNARQDDHLLPLSTRWLGTLPRDVAPHVLAAEFPRIVNLLALEWRNRQACSSYFESLLGDLRGNRVGFPPRAREELLRLREFWYAGAVKR